MNPRLCIRNALIWLFFVLFLEWFDATWLLIEKGLYFDKLLHFAGGVTAGFAGLALVAAMGPNMPREEIFGLYTPLGLHQINVTIVVGAVGAAFVIGIVWEILQHIWPWLRDFSDQTWADTIADVIFDTLGGGYVAYRFVFRKSETSESIRTKN